MSVCPHCDRPVIEAVMRKSGAPVRLDPEPLERGNLSVAELGQVVDFIPPEYRDPKSKWFVPPEERYRSHMVSCPANDRSSTSATSSFIETCDRRLVDGDPVVRIVDFETHEQTHITFSQTA